MKTAITFAVALSLMATAHAQSPEKVEVTEPFFVENFTDDFVTASGINGDGSIIYGQDPTLSTVFYDFNNTQEPYFRVQAGDDDFFGITPGGITNDRLVLLSHYSHSYLYDLNKKAIAANLPSPKEGKGVDAWTITPDGSIIGCNLSSMEDFSVEPMLAFRQEDGTYKFEKLPYDNIDAMGCESQYTQVRYISDNGKYVLGIQPDNRGLSGRIVVWTRQDDGSYSFSTPMDDFLYDFTIEKPGLAPEWSDYVTANPDTEPELFNQQMEEFDKIFNEFEQKYNDFTRGGSSIELYLINRSAHGNTICLGFYDRTLLTSETQDEMEIMTPVFYDFENNKIEHLRDISSSFGFQTLPDGNRIVAKSEGGLYSISMVDKEGAQQPLHEWLTNITGTDLSAWYTYTYYDFMNDVEVEGVFMGLPYISKDGKTMMLAGHDPDKGDVTSVIRFSESILGDDATGIQENKASLVVVADGIIRIGEGQQGTADIYAMNGSKCGSYQFDGELNLNGQLSKGAYIARVAVEGEQPVSIKFVIR